MGAVDGIDDIGPWSEVKLDIIRDYGSAYSRILSKQPGLRHAYIDAFAGAGYHRSRAKGMFVLGSPLNALSVDPPFREYYFIDLDSRKVNSLLEQGLGSAIRDQRSNGLCCDGEPDDAASGRPGLRSTWMTFQTHSNMGHLAGCRFFV